MTPALVGGVETMPTRRKDKAAGTKSAYLDEDPAAAADMVVGGDLPFDEGTGHRASETA